MEEVYKKWRVCVGGGAHHSLRRVVRKVRDALEVDQKDSSAKYSERRTQKQRKRGKKGRERASQSRQKKRPSCTPRPSGRSWAEKTAEIELGRVGEKTQKKNKQTGQDRVTVGGREVVVGGRVLGS